MLLKTKQIIADYATGLFGNQETPYTADNVELPDAYIYFDGNNNILYDGSLELIGCSSGSITPVYLNSRNIPRNSIIFDSNVAYAKPSLIGTPLSLFISSLPEGTVNKISLNADDYIIFEGLI